MSEIAVKADNVSMMFNLSSDKVMSLKEYAIKFIKKQLFFDEFWALKNVSFEIKRGEVFGIMGLNGAGKSTLLKVIAGVYKPTSGQIWVDGAIVPLIELGAGFDPEFTARENIFMNGALFGFSQKFMEGIYDEIMDFAELWSFADTPVKKFSSGMVARLGFSIAVTLKPEIMIVDEILGVGDYKFREKCKERIKQLFHSGATILMVSHDINQIKQLCTRAMLLKSGEVAAIGGVEDVCEIYGQG